ncbi:putative methionine--tRNA ligase [Symbiodinium microadriaticum]|uniref:Putative methionine--tRNA ligase n=1 Tax=Symbiodinium microadriaticum TaxID=2951 RepID=A0A1Q9C2E2_SYMMI|nr:putative methionine--tRNA ligase [Symbiodinium microadriaticum]
MARSHQQLPVVRQLRRPFGTVLGAALSSLLVLVGTGTSFVSQRGSSSLSRSRIGQFSVLAASPAPLGLGTFFRRAEAAPSSGPGGFGLGLGFAGVLAGRILQRRGCQVARKGQSDVSMIDFRVGEIKSCEKHPDSDKLLVEQIDVGEEAPRQICSGIGKFLVPDQVVGKKVVIVPPGKEKQVERLRKSCQSLMACRSNLKARKMAGTASEGMLLCASKKADPEDAESELAELTLVEAPEEAEVGERVVVEMPDEEHGQAATPNKVGKKKLYEKVAPDLRTNKDGTVCFKDSPFMTSAGPCTAKDLPEAVVS